MLWCFEQNCSNSTLKNSGASLVIVGLAIPTFQNACDNHCDLFVEFDCLNTRE